MSYPRKLADLAAARAGKVSTDADAEGVAANLTCGSYLRFFLSLDNDGLISSVIFRSNGCGYMLASAEVLADHITRLDPRELHGLKNDDLGAVIFEQLKDIPNDRELCAESAIDALRAAFADLRVRRVEEFRGEEALICSCFGVTETAVEGVIATGEVATVDDVTDACRAGGGCGACRMLIQEMLDSHPR